MTNLMNASIRITFFEHACTLIISSQSSFPGLATRNANIILLNKGDRQRTSPRSISQSWQHSQFLFLLPMNRPELLVQLRIISSKSISRIASCRKLTAELRGCDNRFSVRRSLVDSPIVTSEL